MGQDTILIVILGMAAVTYIPRVLPIAALAGRRLPEPVTRFLHYIPPAVLAALLAPSLLTSQGDLWISGDNYFLLAAGPCFILALWRRGFFSVVALGMALVAGLRFWAG
ncbi:MAG: AzlD domain-containing protein [Desulfovibrionaceae bacterium]